jgi:hypothetical protein
MFLRFPVDLTRPPAALDFSSQFPVLILGKNRLRSLPNREIESDSRVG